MCWLRLVPFAAAAGAGIIWVAVYAQAPAPRTQFVLTDREALLLSSPQIVAPPTVTQAKWSTDGRYVLAAREDVLASPDPEQPPSGETSLILWNRSTRRSQEIWTRPFPAASVEQIAWLPGTEVALAVVRLVRIERSPGPPGRPMAEYHRELLRIQGMRAPVRIVADLLHGESLLLAPAQPLAILWSGETESLRTVHADGSLGPVIKLPNGVFSPEWAQDGSLVVPGWERPPAPSSPPPAMKWSAIDPRSGQIRALSTQPQFYADRPKPLPVLLRSSSLDLREESATERVTPLWLETVDKSEQPRAFVCADAAWAQLAPDGGAILYLSQGAAWATPLLRLPKEAFLAARREALQKVAISNARQIGLGFMMYLQDYDEMLPPAEGVTDRVLAYLKNAEVFKTPGTDTIGFVYLRGVESVSEFKEPAKTQLGYVPGPGGRAVIYVDGHAEWQDDGRGQ